MKGQNQAAVHIYHRILHGTKINKLDSLGNLCIYKTHATGFFLREIESKK